MPRKKAKPAAAAEPVAVTPPEPSLHDRLSAPEPADAVKPLTSRRQRRIAEGVQDA